MVTGIAFIEQRDKEKAVCKQPLHRLPRFGVPCAYPIKQLRWQMVFIKESVGNGKIRPIPVLFPIWEQRGRWEQWRWVLTHQACGGASSIWSRAY
jgi:hypothetical protein